jgi:hypothetical protein
MTAMDGRARGQAGVLAGSDGLVFGMLILLAGSLAVLNIWSVIDTRAALDAAAREYLRSYTEQSSPAAAASFGDAAARELLERRGAPVHGLRIDPPDAATFGPCQPAVVAIEAEVPAARLPFLDDLGTRQIRVTHRELVDPHREVISGPNHDPTATPCNDD